MNRIRQLRDTKWKLQQLVDALQQVRDDPDASKLLDQALESTADGTGTSASDLQHLFACCLAHAYGKIEVEKMRAEQRPLRVVPA